MGCAMFSPSRPPPLSAGDRLAGLHVAGQRGVRRACLTAGDRAGVLSRAQRRTQRHGVVRGARRALIITAGPSLHLPRFACPNRSLVVNGSSTPGSASPAVWRCPDYCRPWRPRVSSAASRMANCSINWNATSRPCVARPDRSGCATTRIRSGCRPRQKTG